MRIFETYFYLFIEWHLDSNLLEVFLKCSNRCLWVWVWVWVCLWVVLLKWCHLRWCLPKDTACHHNNTLKPCLLKDTLPKDIPCNLLWMVTNNLWDINSLCTNKFHKDINNPLATIPNNKCQWEECQYKICHTRSWILIATNATVQVGMLTRASIATNAFASIAKELASTATIWKLSITERATTFKIVSLLQRA